MSEHGLTSPPTQYRLSGREVKRPNQQHQSKKDKIKHKKHNKHTKHRKSPSLQ